MLRRRDIPFLFIFACLLASLVGCAAPSTSSSTSPGLKVLAVETFLADIARNVAGGRLEVHALLPLGVDPHGFEPTPGDMRKVADCEVLIINGAGLEEGFLDKVLQNVGGTRFVIEAAEGLISRQPQEGEVFDVGDTDYAQCDPHFWLDPNYVIRYVENIRDGLSKADPVGAGIYAAAANAYIAELKELDLWVKEQVKSVPMDRRLLVTNHESLGYFADRYGFQVVGTIIPSVSTGASPSAQQITQLVERIKSASVKAIFLETGANPQLARQIAEETGVRVVTELYTHSTSEAGGQAPTYVDMIRYNTKTIVDALR